nr:hypothetical protein [Actinomycetota bacterium]
MTWSVTDAARVGVALVVVVAPGSAGLLAIGVRRTFWHVALAVPLSAAVATLTAAACAVVHVGYGPIPLGLVTAGLIAVVLARRPALVEDADDDDRRWPGGPVAVLGLVLGAVGIALSLKSWMSGIGPLSTVAQEHDMIVHGVATAFIERTGRGAPWQIVPADVLTGGHVSFYPSGLHLMMAATARLTGSVVIGMNAVTVVVLGVAWPLSAGALAYATARRIGLDRAAGVLGGGIAALVAPGLYRPVFSLLQEGGVLSNAASLVLAPGVIAAVVA